MTPVSGPPLNRVERATLAATFVGAADRFGDLPALRWRTGEEWANLSYREAEDRVARIAAWLVAMGVRSGDRVGILSENRPEWPLFDYAALCVGAITVPVYPSLPADQVAYILRDAGVRGVAASTPEQLEKLASLGSGLLEWTVLFGDAPMAAPAADEAEGLRTGEAATAEPQAAAAVTTGDPHAVAFRTVLDGAPLPDLRARAAAVRPDDVATVVYSSGTTGTPKGVMLSHGNMAFMVAATRQQGAIRSDPGEVSLSILPLSHVLERASEYFFWDEGVTIAYAQAIETLAEDLLAVRPNIMVSVPRLFEKLHARV
ncbi:MAG: AMP-binding protein, partial [Gemmatimonadota bacterium]